MREKLYIYGNLVIDNQIQQNDFVDDGVEIFISGDFIDYAGDEPIIGESDVWISPSDFPKQVKDITIFYKMPINNTNEKIVWERE